MIFLNTFFLYLLPLALIPLLIHLLNLLRYRKVPWAATRFIFNIDRHSTRRIKLLQWLLLAARILLLAFLVLALARPLFRGLLEQWSWGAPKNTLIVFDRSASMNDPDPSGKTAHDLALQTVKAICATSSGRFYLIETVDSKVVEVPDPMSLQKNSRLAPTDTPADFPRLFAELTRFLSQENLGDVDIHVLSDLRSADWRVESPLWTGVAASLRPKSQEVRLRILDCSPPSSQPSRRLEIAKMTLAEKEKDHTLMFTLKLDNQGAVPMGVDLSYTLNGVSTATDPITPKSSQVDYFRRELKLPQGQPTAWGCWRISGDGGACGRSAYFAAGSAGKKKVAVVADHSDHTAEMVASALSCGTQGELDVIRLDTGGPIDLKDASAVVALGLLPPQVDAAIAEVVGKGAQALLFPAADAPSIEVAVSGSSEGRVVSRWERQSGILADALDGSPMPVEQVVCRKLLSGEPQGEACASLADGKAWLAKRHIGGGTLYECRTALDPTWSNLSGTPLFVIMLQRLVEDAFVASGPVRRFDCGELRAESFSSDVEPLCVNGNGAALTRAGVYRIGVTTIVLNVPRSELSPSKMDTSGFESIFKGVPCSFSSAGGGLGGGREAWPLLVLAAMAMCLLESIAALLLTGGAPQVSEK